MESSSKTLQKIHHPVHWGPSHPVNRQKTQKTTGPRPGSGLLGDVVAMFSCQVGTR